MNTKINAKWTEEAISHFMTELIDYAGIFPPAALDLSDAIINYQSYIKGSDSWMLGPFVIPVNRLNELEPFKALFSEEHPLRLSIILTKSEKFEHDMKAINLFLETYETAGTVEGIEIPLPPQVNPSLLKKIENKTENYHVYCEITGTNDQLTHTLDAIQTINQKSLKRIGIKLRMGGIKAHFFPSANQVAFVINECRKRGLALKFTAGLHHPIRQYRNEVETKMHGFVNVFTASIMAYCHEVDEATLQAILLDEDPADFSFTPDALSWCNKTVSATEINKARSLFAASYGSCSFEEPREELGELTIFHGEATQ
ncbi:MAG: hypothetical protein ACQEWV_13995 [Bacillota bacterium]